MKRYNRYIDKKFSDELKLLIYLSQDDISEKSCPVELENINWKVFIQLTLKHRLVSHVLKHAPFLAENFPIPTYEKLIDIRLNRSKISLNYAIHIIRIYQKFEENQIQHCFFKGPLLSLELYKDVGFRNFRDIDVLVEKKDVERAKLIIEDLGFVCNYPKKKLTEKQKRINYSISHHYHFSHPVQATEVELHWNITNPGSYYNRNTGQIISDSRKFKVSNYHIPYISEIDNIVFQASHGAVHQWYRLFWLKDFSVLLPNIKTKELHEALELSKKLNLDKTFYQACQLSELFFGSKTKLEIKKAGKYLLKTPLNSIGSTDLSHKGIGGKLRYVFYRLRLKTNFIYYWELIYRLRTHLTDWEIIKLNDSFFFLYYILRPFLLLYKFLFKRKRPID